MTNSTCFLRKIRNETNRTSTQHNSSEMLCLLSIRRNGDDIRDKNKNQTNEQIMNFIFCA